MRFRIRTTLLAFALSMVAAAPAAALIPCDLCEPHMHQTRCAGICNGHTVRYCSEWFYYGCEGSGIQLAQSRMAEEAGMDSEEQFLRSLREEEAAPAGLE